MESLMERKMKLVLGYKSDDDYYLITPKKVKMEKILKAIYDNTGMRKNSFADLEVKKFFSDLFSNAVDLKDIYNEYYIDEYDSFKQFLYNHETMDNEFIDMVNLSENDTLWDLKYQINNYGVKDIIGYDNENLPILNCFLEGIQV